MSNFRFGDWEAHVTYEPGMLGWYLYLMKQHPDGRQFLTENGTISVIKQGEQFKKTEKLHFAYFEDEQQLQAIADAISNRGIKSSNYHKNEGLLEATRTHLDDMRKLVFKATDFTQQASTNVRTLDLSRASQEDSIKDSKD